MSAEKFARKYRIASARAAWWDYASDGVYFITICTDKRKHFFGHVADKKMILSALGKIAHQYWQQIPQHFPFVSLDEFVIMPNHVHGIIVIDKSKYGNTTVPTHDYASPIETQNFASPIETHDYASPPQTTQQNIPVQNNPQTHPLNKFGPQSQNLGSIVRGFKSAVKTYATMNHLDFGWQSRFHDHIVRNEMEYHRIAEYIRTNPERWGIDKFFTTQ
jgi:REP element-mobilizing transposase RayT